MAKTDHLDALVTAAGVLAAVGMMLLTMLMVVELGPAEAPFRAITVS